MHDEAYFELITPLWHLYLAQDEAGIRAAVAAQRHALEVRIEDLAKVPDEALKRADVANAWVQFVLFLAQLLADVGFSDLQDRLMDTTDNPIDRWYDDLAAADRMRAEGAYAASSEKLSVLLDELSNSTGSAVDRLLPMTLGLLGANAFDTNDVARALTLTEQALAASEATGDADGVRTYSENLATIRAAADADDAMSELRRRLARGQVLHDSGRLDEARQLLESVVDGLPAAPCTYHPKAFGLLGMIAYRLGDLDVAESTTRRAIDAGRAVDDQGAVVIYSANLSVIDRARDRE